MFKQLRAGRIAVVVAVVLSVVLGSVSAASAKSLEFRSVDERAGVFTFKLRGLEQRRVLSTVVRVGRDRRVVGPRRVRRGAQRGELRVRAPHRTFTLLQRARATDDRYRRAVLVVRTRPSAPVGKGCGVSLVGSFGVDAWPGGCWRPYSDSSPFNRSLGASPRVDAGSDAVVDRVMGFGPLQHLVAGQAGRKDDWGHPTYYSKPSDPEFTLSCTEDWGRCDVEGMRIRIPDQARAPGGSDGHMTVVDQVSGWEYDMWRVTSKPRGGGTLEFAWGGRTRIDGDGLGSNAVAARFGNMAGKLRAEELEAGEINHALFMVVNCDSGEFVYPAAQSGRECSSIGKSNKDAPPMGARFQLEMSDAEIAALDVPVWKKTILRAMAHYGMYVGDTGGSWSIKEESGLTYTSFGRADKWVELAKRYQVPRYEPDNNWIYNLRDDVDWASRLRVIDPCEAQGTC